MFDIHIVVPKLGSVRNLNTEGAEIGYFTIVFGIQCPSESCKF